ncbi:MAG: hypothetical protein HY714_06325, partial [Candidatus Omnitrophica bacterium]|nr:hypothetical protein [Candidatus Omnitrophota bacterium]
MKGLASAVLACSVCFGDPSSLTMKSVKISVLALLGVVGFVLASIGFVIFTWAARARRLGRGGQG